MNKLTKISATALVALFLAACDKPTPAASTAPAAQTAPAATAPATTEAPSAEALADFKKLEAWNKEQEQALAPLQAEMQQKFASKDPAQMEEASNKFTQKVNEVIKSLDDISVSDDQIKTFKEKMKTVMVLSNEMVTHTIKAAQGDATAQQKVQEQAQTLIQEGQALQQMQLDLQKRFATQ